MTCSIEHINKTHSVIFSEKANPKDKFKSNKPRKKSNVNCIKLTASFLFITYFGILIPMAFASHLLMLSELRFYVCYMQHYKCSAIRKP